MIKTPAAAHLADTMPPEEISAPPSPTGRPTAAEQEMLDQFDAQRRLALLRIILPGLLVVTMLGLIFSIQTDIASGGDLSSSLQAGVGLVAFVAAYWATWRRRANLASLAFFAGIAGVIILLLINDAIQVPLNLPTLPEFDLLLLPVLISGVFGGPRQVAVTTMGTVLFTFVTITFTQHTTALQNALAASNGLAVYTIPISTQITSGMLIFAATYGYRRTQRELGDIRIAYAREKELERLKDQFISSVNHELRTPIMALQGYIEIAQELGARGETSRQTQILVRGAEAADHLATLVRSALSVSRIESNAARSTPESFHLLPAVLATTDLLDPREAGDRERELHIEVPEELAVYADQEHVRQVLLNLLSNASKYSAAGSPIEIKARIAPARGAKGRSSKTALLQLVEVSVRDHGLGIPPDQIPLLFQRFVRLERDLASSVSGTGLGLAICKSYVEAMGGTIWVESTGVSGEGSTFTFTLPLAPTSSTSSINGSNSASPVSSTGSTTPTSTSPTS
jgi:signal transduction histidine kinase